MISRWKIVSALLLVVLIVSTPAARVVAQGNPLPAPNLALVYDQNGATLVNISAAPVSLAGLNLMRAGGVVNYAPLRLASTLNRGECVQIRSAAEQLPLPPECTRLVRWLRSNRADVGFWKADYPNEPFRPQYNGSALTICNTMLGRCEFHLPQGASAAVLWDVPDPKTGILMPPGMQVAYDANQLWIGHLAAGTIMPTGRDLRFIYTRRDGVPTLWTPADGPWDGTGWDNRGLNAGECLVLYNDPARITPLLPCTPVAYSPQPDQLWLLPFDVMGPREERRSPCGGETPLDGAVLCIVGG